MVEAMPGISHGNTDIIETEGQPLFLNVSVSGRPTPTITWSSSLERGVDLSNGSQFVAFATLVHSGVYTISATNEHGSKNVTFNVSVKSEWQCEGIHAHIVYIDLSGSHCVAIMQVQVYYTLIHKCVLGAHWARWNTNPRLQHSGNTWYKVFFVCDTNIG